MLRRLTISLAGVVVLLGLTPSMAQATEEFSFEIPSTGVFQEGVIKEVPTPENLHEARCEVTATAVNNDSTRPGTNLIVASNGSSVVLRDVEREAGAVVTVAGGVLVLNGTITVSVEFGPEKAFSGGLTVSFACEPVEPEPVNHPRASITTPGCEDNPVFTATLDNEDSDEAQPFELKLNGSVLRTVTVQAGKTETVQVHAHDGDRLQVTGLAEANADLSKCDKDKPKPPQGSSLTGHDNDKHGKHYGGTAMTGTREEVIRWCLFLIIGLLVIAGASFIGSRKAGEVR